MPRTLRSPRRRLATALAPGFVGVIAFTSALLNTHFDAPPRYDGAGYAVLGWSLASGRGYHEISHPEAPPHTHFPPGYPLALALLFRGAGPSVAMAHGFSLLCTTLAAVAAWAWFRRLYSPGTALLLGTAVAVNWTWGRSGGAIQSEPLFLLLSMTASLAATGAERRGTAWGIVVGLLLAACVLTRHVGICLVAAVVLDMLLRRRPGMACLTAATTIAGLVPWVGWLLWSRRGTQAGLFHAQELVPTLASQALFYTRRIPDQVVGPFVEIATIYRGGRLLGGLATAGAVIVTAIVVCGWVRTLLIPRRRLAGLIASATMALLLAWPFTEAGRFLIPLVPFVLVGAVEGLVPLLRPLRLRPPRRWAAGLVLVLSLPYPAYSIATGRAQAAQRTHTAFDAACAWLAGQHDVAGPILTHYSADAFWQTRRPALDVPGNDLVSIARTIDRYGVAYLLVEEQPFTNAEADPLGRYIAAHPARVRLVWGEPQHVAVYQWLPATRP